MLKSMSNWFALLCHTAVSLCYATRYQPSFAGFSVTGIAKEGNLMSKGTMQDGQTLILTKPLGTGTIMAAAMRRKAKGRWVMGPCLIPYRHVSPHAVMFGLQPEAELWHPCSIQQH